MFDGYRHFSNDIRVLYRLFRTDTDETNQAYELFPGYKNLDANGNVVSVQIMMVYQIRSSISRTLMMILGVMNTLRKIWHSLMDSKLKL